MNGDRILWMSGRTLKVEYLLVSGTKGIDKCKSVGEKKSGSRRTWNGAYSNIMMDD
jgi:hypothetical protein